MFLSGSPFLGLTSLCRKAQFLWMNSSLSVKFAAASSLRNVQLSCFPGPKFRLLLCIRVVCGPLPPQKFVLPDSLDELLPSVIVEQEGLAARLLLRLTLFIVPFRV
ncbi:hypothetical protein DPMN_166142 [Dreissena polymorpha]|uniref:Uncharacterized protein n=1 Tax=Dreissena polymorpha TaxID=45954 RepID=A0A9D4IX44_DREPO|nr:hypothetical protein DPMN_166142 [Dreissena polymorpha]